MILHAGLVARRVDGVWLGALIEGPSGAGKSDLALRALSEGFRLVADDRVLIWESGGGLFGRAPDALAGLIEVRGQGVLAAAALSHCRIGLVCSCEPAERHPDPEVVTRLGCSVPRLAIAPLEASAPAKIRRALEHLGCAAQEAYQAQPVARILPRPCGDSR